MDCSDGFHTNHRGDALPEDMDLKASKRLKPVLKFIQANLAFVPREQVPNCVDNRGGPTNSDWFRNLAHCGNQAGKAANLSRWPGAELSQGRIF